MVDCTFGAGGHARLVAERIAPNGELVCIDRDPQAAEQFAAFAAEAPAATRFMRGDYAEVLPALRGRGLRADLLYMDLGVSSMQVDTRERGFSYSYDAPLDMRMDPAQQLDARTAVNEWPERRLAAVIREYGEERYAGRSRERSRAPASARRSRRHRPGGGDQARRADPAQFGGGHPAKRSFQAIRIAVNDELGSLERALPEAWDLLRPGGRMAVISFHSLEDRRVKRFFADRARGCICPPDLPVCVCGHEPEAELLNRRADRARAPARSPATRGRGPASCAPR